MIESILLPLGETVSLSTPLPSGGAVVFRSEIFDGSPQTNSTDIDNTSLNLKNGNDILIHFSIRRTEGVVVLNSLPEGGSWGKEERVPLDGAFSHPDISVVVFDYLSHYDILCGSKPFYQFAKRIKKPTTAVSYQINSGQTPPFSDAIAVHTIHSIATLLRKSSFTHPGFVLGAPFDREEKATTNATFSHKAGLWELPGDSYRKTNRLGFEYAEHSFLGDAITLKLDGGATVLAKKYHFTLLNGLRVTYGEINGLAGDFYGTSKPISDGHTSGEQRSRFNQAYATLANSSTPKETMDILRVLTKEVDAVNHALQDGEDPSVAYSKLPDETMKFEWITSSRPHGVPGYLGLAKINWDHFGEDARIAYNAGHGLALELAAGGHLLKAYALNAFADHFLEDSFSAGHMRTPRRMLHDDSVWKTPVKDLLAKYMHDEDCAIGLSVANPAGERWTAYGDKRCLDVENTDNRQRCMAAIQASADEIYHAHVSGKIPEPQHYKAWTHACTLESTRSDRDQELAPLFKLGEQRRKEIKNRRKHEFTQDWWAATTAALCWNSGWWKYPITIDGP